MSYNRSLVVVCPAALWPALRAMNAAMGLEAGEGVPLSADGKEPVTHRGLHTWAQDSFADCVTGRALPAGVDAKASADFLDLFQITERGAPVVIGSTLWEAKPGRISLDGADSPVEHFAQVCASCVVQSMTPDEEGLG